MNWRKLVDCFDLNHYRLFYDQIETIAAIEFHVPINDWQWFLSFDLQSDLPCSNARRFRKLTPAIPPQARCTSIAPDNPPRKSNRACLFLPFLAFSACSAVKVLRVEPVQHSRTESSSAVNLLALPLVDVAPAFPGDYLLVFPIPASRRRLRRGAQQRLASFQSMVPSPATNANPGLRHYRERAWRHQLFHNLECLAHRALMWAFRNRSRFQHRQNALHGSFPSIDREWKSSFGIFSSRRPPQRFGEGAQMLDGGHADSNFFSLKLSLGNPGVAPESETESARDLERRFTSSIACTAPRDPWKPG